MADEVTIIAAGVPKETYPGESRVAVIPDVVPLFTKAGVRIMVEAGAGLGSGITDESYVRKGAEVASDRKAVFDASRVILQVRGYGANPRQGASDLDLFHPGQALISFFEPLAAIEEVRAIAKRGVAVFAIELMPRITRAQSMDALSSMATIAGYKAVIMAADLLPRMFPMLMTAAGTISPARVFVIGAGVAGLQAIASARRLGAVVRSYDVRPAVKEQVESLGAAFVQLAVEAGDSEDKSGYAKEMDETFYRKQRDLMAEVVADSDVVITMAAVPGKKAPVLITADMVRAMRRGSVVIDIAAERGGNCELTRAGETVIDTGVTVVGPVNLPSTVPFHASQMYSRNLLAFVRHLIREGEIGFDLNDEITRDTLLTLGGKVVNLRIRDVLGPDTTAKRSEI